MVTITKATIHQNEMFTFHSTGPYGISEWWNIELNGPAGVNLHNECVLKIQEKLAECKAAGQRFRALGSLWSFNDIAFNKGWVLDNSNMKIVLKLSPTDMHAASKVSHDNIIFTQCGVTVNLLSDYLKDRNKSLKVSGGSNGQTIGGATSTGVHGGSFDNQCISDYIKGMHIITGPEANDRIYLERSSDPVLCDTFAAQFNSRIIRDDAIFNAAIVGLGSFGFIAAFVLEVEDLYSLRRYVRTINYDDAIELSATLDFENSPFKIAEETDNNNKPIRPYHFKTYINQYTKDSVAEVIYKIPYQPTVYPAFEIGTQMHPDIFRLMRWALEKSDGKIANLLSRLIQGEAMPKPDNPVPLTGTLGEVFRAVNYQEKGFSWALGVNHHQLKPAMQTWLKIFDQFKAPGLSAIKMVRQTKATIGFHKFPITAVIHMDGIQWTPADNQLIIQKEIIKAFTDANIDFTLHWGKNAAWDYPSLINIMYPGAKEEWIKQRNRLLRPEMAFMFSNDFLQRLGLDTIIPVTDSVA
jgi:hypothetical protein